MNGRPFPRILAALALGLALALAAPTATAQQLILKGEFGMKAGTQPPPGLYAGAIGALNWSDTLKGPDGNSLPSDGGSFNQYIPAVMVMYTSKLKILGANYGALAAVPFSNATIDFPRLNTSGSTGMALSQLWIVPVSLGWHLKDPLPLAPGGMDITFHYAFYPPTGRYTPGATDNTGLGMWANEFSLRTTAFFDKDKKWHGSASLFYDINGKKKDTDFKYGNPFTYMWGLGRDYGDPKSLFSGWLGAAGYAQWQVTSTTGAPLPIIDENKTRIFAAGPELTTLQGALTIRYFWQFGGQFSTQGRGLYVQFMMPLPF